MTRLVLFFILLLPVNLKAATEYPRYHQTMEINGIMQDLAETHPDLCHYKTLGFSAEGREISYLVISKPTPYPKKNIYFNATHHGNEGSSTEASLGLIQYIATHHHDPKIMALLKKVNLYIQPLVNPDGHASNSRFDSTGSDPNRDYGSPGKLAAFKLTETRLVKQLMEKVGFDGAIAYHSGMEGVLWPWGYTGERNLKETLFRFMSLTTAHAMGLKYYAQSSDSYPAQGEFIDYAYSKFGTAALTVEVSRSRSPALIELPDVIDRSIRGALAFIEQIAAPREPIMASTP